MNPVVHFEMPAKDTKRMAKFYSAVFGWETQILGPEMRGYVIANTTETGEDGRPRNPGAINGGFFQRDEETDCNYPRVVIAVEDIRKVIKAVEDTGGSVQGEPHEIPGVGQFVNFNDTEGNLVCLLQPAEMNKQET